MSKKPMLRVVGGTEVMLGDDLASRQSSFRTSAERPSDGTLSITAKNKRLRDARRDIWRSAEAAAGYWRARIDFEAALLRAQNRELPEGDYHPLVDSKERIPMVERWREAQVKQLLTPAPDTAAVTWKRAALAAGQYRHIGVRPERIERAIDDDVAWLAAHPFRIKLREGGQQ